MRGFFSASSPFFHYAAILFSLILVVQILFRRDRKTFSNRLLLLFLLCNSYSIFLFLLVKSELIFNFWHLYKTAIPTTFLIPPIVYFYLRSIIFDENKFKRSDWIHLFPAIISLIQYLPYYFSVKKAKLSALQVFIETGHDLPEIGIVSEENFILFRIGVTLLYLFLIVNLLVNKFHQLPSPRVKHSKYLDKLKAWIWVFGISYLINNLAIIVYFILIKYYLQGEGQEFIFNLGVVVANLFNLSLLAYSAFLLIWPEILIGLDYSSNSSTQKVSTFDKRIMNRELDHELDKDYANILSAIKQEKIYLNASTRIQDLAELVNLSIRRTSFVINMRFEGNFSQLMNKYRIEEAIQQINAGYLENYTLDSLYQHVGFANRATFFAAFKKITGMTPKQFSTPE